MSRDITKVEVMGLEPTNLLTASQALYQLSYTPRGRITLSGVDGPLILRPARAATEPRLVVP